VKKGVIWFLNLAYSYKKHMIHNGTGEMKWYSVFGNKQTTGMMKGTVDFPAVKVLGDDVLLKQVGDFSCGIGLVAAVAIILDTAFIGQGTSRVEILFDTKFSDIVVDKAESVIQIPNDFTEPLPKNPTNPTSDYLHDSKEQWFILFDRLAHLQHVIIPRCKDPDVAVKDELLYLSLKAKIESLPWPRREHYRSYNNCSLPARAPGKSDENTTPPDESGDTTHPDDDACSFTAVDLEKDPEMEYAMMRLGRLEKGEQQPG
jgi:hypothetical protein